MASVDHLASDRSLARERPGRVLAREHRFAQDHLSPYLERELPQRDERRVHDHLAGCPQCRRELDQLRRVVTALRRLRTEGRSDPTVDALITQLCRQAEARCAHAVSPALAGRTAYRLDAVRGSSASTSSPGALKTADQMAQRADQ